MKLSDYVADFLASQGVKHVFAVSGGASLHMIHSVADHPGIDFICPQHEQGGAMAADGYARITGNLGVAIGTSGPGATNMITGICSSYYDSVPVLYLTGQVATFRNKSDTGVRQLGFQETDIVPMCRPITKYAATVASTSMIRYELEKAVHTARSGRPGPVLIDLPDDLQRAQIDPATLQGFEPPAEVAAGASLARAAAECAALLAKARRPVVILGWGVRLAKAEAEVRRLVEQLGTPVVPSWGMVDFLPAAHPLSVGTFGTHGTRYGNFTVQNSDLILSIGCRLDTHEVGSPFSHFGRAAAKVIVDIDPAELGKFERFGMKVDLPVAADARDFVTALLAEKPSVDQDVLAGWWKKVRAWKADFPIVQEFYRDQNTLNPYVFVEALSDAAREDDIVVVDTGCAVAWMSQAFRAKEGQRYLHAFNNTPMGYALPAAVGAAFASGAPRIICVAGDGSMQMNVQELATVIRHKLPIKVFLLNNHGFSMIQQTQDQWLGSNYHASSVEGGLGFPDWVALAKAYGFATHTIASNQAALSGVAAILDAPGPAFVNVELESKERVIPQVRFGRPIEDSEPLLDRKRFLAAMIVEPVPASLEP